MRVQQQTGIRMKLGFVTLSIKSFAGLSWSIPRCRCQLFWSTIFRQDTVTPCAPNCRREKFKDVLSMPRHGFFFPFFSSFPFFPLKYQVVKIFVEVSPILRLCYDFDSAIPNRHRQSAFASPHELQTSDCVVIRMQLQKAREAAVRTRKFRNERPRVAKWIPRLWWSRPTTVSSVASLFCRVLEMRECRHIRAAAKRHRKLPSERRCWKMKDWTFERLPSLWWSSPRTMSSMGSRFRRPGRKGREGVSPCLCGL
jgi:hypothetical protein